ncbi:MAG TPA: hypothetical protein VMT68_12270 [Caulobacteraceae bacterium]|nr:hypothetical protein [Caulobacteraceae bacterium]
MHLHVSPDAPIAIQLAAASILALHVAGGAGGVMFGTAAMLAPKGGRLHRVAGTGFFVSMLAMAGVGAAVSPFMAEQQVPNTLAGVFTLYLVATSWATARRRPGKSGAFEVGAMALALIVAAGSTALGAYSLMAAAPLPQPEGGVVWVFAAVSGMAAAVDFVTIERGGLAGRARTRRHLWRMSLALLIAIGSLAGQPVALPPALRGSPLLLIPILAVLVAMIAWQVRLRDRRARTAVAPAQPTLRLAA